MNENLTGYPSIDRPWDKYYTEKAINSDLPEGSLWEYMYENNKNNPDYTALNYFGKKMTYGQLFVNVEAAAKAFVQIGVEKGEIVTIVSLSTPVSIICFYALNRIGAVSNFVNVLAESKDLQVYFKDASSKLVVTLDVFGEKVCEAAKKAGVKNVISFSLGEGMPAFTRLGLNLKMRKMNKSFKDEQFVAEWKTFIKSGENQNISQREKDAKEFCVLGHTGGTTGFPKSVLLSDYQMNAVAHQYRMTMEHEENDTFLNCMIPFIIYGLLTCMHMPLTLGLEVIVIPKFDVTEWKKYLKKYRPVHIASAPSYMLPMMEDESLEDADMSFIRTIAVGGDGMNDDLEKQFNEFIHSKGAKINITKGYGMTEVCATALTEYNHCNKIGSVGIPLFKNCVMIYDNEKKTEMTYGEIGEVCISSPSFMLGYKDEVEATNELIRIHPDATKWLHTGDLGYIDEDGFLFLVGRMKRIILTSRPSEGVAYKVFPNIPEGIIMKHDAVHQVCVVGAMDGINEVLKAYVVLNHDRQDEEKQIEEALIKMCEEELPDYSRPTFYEFRTELPLTPAGKVDFKVLEEK